MRGFTLNKLLPTQSLESPAHFADLQSTFFLAGLIKMFAINIHRVSKILCQMFIYRYFPSLSRLFSFRGHFRGLRKKKIYILQIMIGGKCEKMNIVTTTKKCFI